MNHYKIPQYQSANAELPQIQIWYEALCLCLFVLIERGELLSDVVVGQMGLMFVHVVGCYDRKHNINRQLHPSYNLNNTLIIYLLMRAIPSNII